MEAEEWKEECLDQLEKGTNRDYAYECCDSLHDLYVVTHSMILSMKNAYFNIARVYFVEVQSLVDIVENELDVEDDVFLFVDAVLDSFQDFKKDALHLFHVSHKEVSNVGQIINKVTSNLDRVYHSCALPPEEKVKLINDFTTYTEKLKARLSDVNKSIDNAKKILRKTQRLSDFEDTQDYFHKALDEVSDSILEAIKCLCCMERTLNEYVEKHVGISIHVICGKEACKDKQC
ncbi:MAG: hypothetical protein JHC26_02135 [Thermofilum sp.]|jgi:hypothetical protein|uniref:hypothetical protein n=1 Tax=Thermofilum sp. TaxID=1961369 RepID=UPI0025885A10|nr:hypothetical protein [Thermofilum sp.]MCI4407863.1 hypothetical protein [Thermofilum sp.]